MAKQDERPAAPTDPRLRDRPTGRQPDPADVRPPDVRPPRAADADELNEAVGARPRSADTDQTDDENEDGLDPTEEAVRHAAEDRPTTRRRRP